MQVFYFCHHNWEWVIDDGVKKLQHQSQFRDYAFIKSNRSRDLPSVRHSKQKVKAVYSLFRFELTADDIPTKMIWACSQAFGFLDPKDSLYKLLDANGCQDVMPKTYLIPWDLSDISALQSIIGHDFSFDQFLLKSSLGSGGFGIYFIDNAESVIEVVKGHANKAKSHSGFIEGLIASYGDVPSWNLQRRVFPVCINGLRKTQVRVYVVRCNRQLYMYRNFEVRSPIWDSTAEASGNAQEIVEKEYVGEGTAIPYNSSRVKAETDRLTLSEVEELKDSYDAVEVVVRKAFSSLREVINSHDDVELLNSFDCPDKSILGIAGVDLVVEHLTNEAAEDELIRNGFRAYIVELNNNPAMAGSSKKMSSSYRDHLSDFVQSMALLGLADGSNDAFSVI